ncbi:hypothetical protein HC776_00825 [bacterium]|nr:hypothetical protein [bacterium]
MTDQQRIIQNLQTILDFAANAPENHEIMAMDCNDHCENMACLAERVAQGAPLEEILPDLQRYLLYWRDCREEFMALVAVLKAELSQTMPDLPSRCPPAPNTRTSDL